MAKRISAIEERKPTLGVLFRLLINQSAVAISAYTFLLVIGNSARQVLNALFGEKTEFRSYDVALNHHLNLPEALVAFFNTGSVSFFYQGFAILSGFVAAYLIVRGNYYRSFLFWLSFLSLVLGLGGLTMSLVTNQGAAYIFAIMFIDIRFALVIGLLILASLFAFGRAYYWVFMSAAEQPMYYGAGIRPVYAIWAGLLPYLVVIGLLSIAQTDRSSNALLYLFICSLPGLLGIMSATGQSIEGQGHYLPQSTGINWFWLVTAIGCMAVLHYLEPFNHLNVHFIPFFLESV